MRPKKLRCTGTWKEIESFRMGRKLTQYQMAGLLMIPRGVYGNEVIRHQYVPLDIWKSFQSIKDIPAPTSQQKTYKVLVFDGETFTPFEDDIHVLKCEKCQNDIVTVNSQKKYCSACRRKK